MTIEHYLNQYHTKQTTDSYLRAIDHFLFHSKHKEESGYADIIAYLYEFNYRSPRIIAGIKRYFDYLVETGKRTNHPCKGFNIKRKIVIFNSKNSLQEKNWNCFLIVLFDINSLETGTKRFFHF